MSCPIVSCSDTFGLFENVNGEIAWWVAAVDIASRSVTDPSRNTYPGGVSFPE